MEWELVTKLNNFSYYGEMQRSKTCSVLCMGRGVEGLALDRRAGSCLCGVAHFLEVVRHQFSLVFPQSSKFFFSLNIVL